MKSAEWNKMATAPKNGSPILIYRRGATVAEIARYEDQRHYQAPKPYWQNISGSDGYLMTRDRDNPPLGWLPLPAVPATAKNCTKCGEKLKGELAPDAKLCPLCIDSIKNGGAA